MLIKFISFHLNAMQCTGTSQSLKTFLIENSYLAKDDYFLSYSCIYDILLEEVEEAALGPKMMEEFERALLELKSGKAEGGG